jgi:hypothetical protein
MSMQDKNYHLYLRTPSRNFGVADFGYDFYLLAIAKLLHGQYFRLLDFYFHTLIQQRLLHPTIKIEKFVSIFSTCVIMAIASLKTL